jgi:K+-transporting ATPase ATPase A chain
MTANGWVQILLFALIVFALVKPLGIYMFRVFEGGRQPLPRFFGPIERWIYRLCGVDPKEQQDWKVYTVALLIFSAVTLLVTYAIERLQHILPLNPQKFPSVPADLAFNTAASFTTNTNWQNYGGESVMSYLTQMAGLAWHNFLSAGVGLCVALALARGLTYRLRPEDPKTVGNFWVDLIRSIVYVFLPICIPVTLLLVSQGVIQNFSSYVDVTTLEGAKQTLAMGPVASQEVIKELGTNGGGFFNANSAHPFENPTPLINLIEMLLIFAIPAAVTYTYGRMAHNQKQGWTIFAAMALMFFMGISVAYYYETTGNAALRGLAVDQTTVARSIRCTTASLHWVVSCHWQIFNLGSWFLAGLERDCTLCWSSSYCRFLSPASWSAALPSISARRSNRAKSNCPCSMCSSFRLSFSISPVGRRWRPTPFPP